MEILKINTFSAYCTTLPNIAYMSAGPAPGAEYRSGLDNEKGCNMGHGESGAVWSSVPWPRDDGAIPE